MLSKLYELLWSRLGGEPWTWKVRRAQQAEPLVFMLIFLVAGIVLARLAGRYWWQLLIGYLLGILVGHFWW